jgi:hypothetical protein
VCRPSLVSTVISLLLIAGCDSSGPPKEFDLTIAVTGTGSGVVSVTPTPITGAANCDNLSGSSTVCTAAYFEGQMFTATATPATGSRFVDWSGACTTAAVTCTLSMDSATSVTAAFARIQHSVAITATGIGSGSVSSAPAGISCVASAGAVSGSCSALFNHGTQLTFTANAVAGHTFSGWTNCSEPNGNTCRVTLAAAYAITASFTAPTFGLNIGGAGVGNGVVSSAPGSISCTISNATTTGVCSDNFALGTSIRLTATPASGYVLSSWTGCDSATGNTCIVNIGFNRSVTATFQPLTYRLSFMVAGSAMGGHVTISPGGITCVMASTCQVNVAPGSRVTIQGSPPVGAYSYNWVNCDTLVGETCTITMTADRFAAVTFIPIAGTALVTVTGVGNGNGVVTSATTGITCNATAGATSGTCSHIFPVNSEVTLIAAPANGNMLSGWTGCDTITGLTCKFRMTGAHTVSVSFSVQTNESAGSSKMP